MDRTPSYFSIQFADGISQEKTLVERVYDKTVMVSWPTLLDEFIRFLQGAGYQPGDLLHFRDRLKNEKEQLRREFLGSPSSFKRSEVPTQDWTNEGPTC